MPSPLADLDLSHHAYAIVGGDDIRAELLKTLEKKHKIATTGNADFFDRRYETFTIDDARELKSSAGTKPTTADGLKIFVLTMNGITVEAQNALLKLLEEPAEYAHFFLILPSSHLLLPTVKSRIRVIDSGSHEKSDYNEEVITMANDFLKAPVAKRLDIIKTLMDQIGKEKKTKQDAIDLLNQLEEAIHGKGVKGPNIKALEAVLLAGKYSSDRAPSMKMLLEYVAMNV